MLTPKLVAGPAAPVVPLEELKAHLRVDFDDDDAAITALEAAATRYLDGYHGLLALCLVEQTWSEAFPGYPQGASYACGETMKNVLRLSLAPVSEIVSIEFYNAADGSTQADDTDHLLLSDALGFFIASVPGAESPWPSAVQERADAVTVTYKAGYGAAGTDVPEPIRHAVRLMVAGWYEQREYLGPAGAQEIPIGAMSLVAPYRRAFFV